MQIDRYGRKREIEGKWRKERKNRLIRECGGVDTIKLVENQNAVNFLYGDWLLLLKLLRKVSWKRRFRRKDGMGGFFFLIDCGWLLVIWCLYMVCETSNFS